MRTSEEGAAKMTERASADKPCLVLIHPITGFWDGFRSSPSLPLNLLHAVSLIADKFKIELIDLRIHRDWEKRLAAAMEKRPLLVGTTSMIGPATVSSIHAAEKSAGVPVVMGGVHSTLNSDSALREDSLDYVVCGEGEIPFAKLAQNLLNEGDGSDIPGVKCKFKNGDDAGYSVCAERIDLNSSPEIPYGIVETEKYLQYFRGEGRYISMETSRGCPYKCGYCYHGRPEYSGWRAQQPERVYERARFAKERFGAGGAYFVDDNFFVDKNRAAAIASHMAELGFKWQVQGVDITSLREMGTDYLSHLCASGLTRITLGIDTGSERTRQRIRKPVGRDETIETIRRLSSFPIIVYCSFIVNFPGETSADLKNTASMVVELSKANPNFRNSPIYQFVPFPGTRLAEDMSRNGFKWPEKFKDWGAYSFETGYDADNAGVGRAVYKALYFVTLFSDGKSREYLSSPLLRLISRLYQPVAMLRLSKFIMKPIPEMSVFYMLRDFLLRRRETAARA